MKAKFSEPSFIFPPSEKKFLSHIQPPKKQNEEDRMLSRASPERSGSESSEMCKDSLLQGTHQHVPMKS